jgi:hypothetical protein
MRHEAMVHAAVQRYYTQEMRLSNDVVVHSILTVVYGLQVLNART